MRHFTDQSAQMPRLTVNDQSDLYYRLHVFVCTNERPATHSKGSCAGRGSVELCDYMKARAKELGLNKQHVRIQQAACLNRCALGPVLVIYPEGVWYVPQTREDIDEILLSHLCEGKRVQRLVAQCDDMKRSDLEHRS